MIQPALKDEALLADIRTANRNDHQFRLWWLGQSGFLLQWKGEHLSVRSLSVRFADQEVRRHRQAACPNDGTGR